MEAKFPLRIHVTPAWLCVSTIFSGCWLYQPTFALINYTEVLLHYFSSFNNWHPNASIKKFRLFYLMFWLPFPPASCGRVRDNDGLEPFSACKPFRIILWVLQIYSIVVIIQLALETKSSAWAPRRLYVCPLWGEQTIQAMRLQPD